MDRWRVLLGLAVLAMPATAMAQEMEPVSNPIDAPSEVRAQIEAASASWAEALNSGDVESLILLFTDDAVLFPPFAAPVEGREAIRTHLQAELEMMEGVEIAFETSDVLLVGDMAIETGGYTVTADDGTHIDHGKFLTAWTSTDEGWKATYDIWNTSMSPEALMKTHQKMMQDHGMREGAMDDAEDTMDEAADAPM